MVAVECGCVETAVRLDRPAILAATVSLRSLQPKLSRKAANAEQPAAFSGAPQDCIWPHFAAPNIQIASRWPLCF